MKSISTVAEICLYGTTRTGSGWLVCIADGTHTGRMLGDGKPRFGSMSEAVWAAAMALFTAGILKGAVRIFAPDGLQCADVELTSHIPPFGQLRWKHAPGYVISAEEIIAHAEVAP
jgi:hypothetical protein